VAKIADKGYEKALEENEALNKGLNLLDGKVICSGSPRPSDWLAR